jgi:hypothetical protein
LPPGDTSDNLPLVPLTPAENLPLVSLTPVENFPLVSTTPAIPVAKFAAGVVDTSGKFTTGVVDTGSAPSLAIISANFRKNQNDPNVIFRGLRKMILEKNLTQKILSDFPFKCRKICANCSTCKGNAKSLDI